MTLTIDPVAIEASTVFANVPVASMIVGSYGRALDSTAVTRLMRQWDERAIGAIMLSLRNDGTYAIIDGQHRVEVARRLGIPELPSRVYIDLSIADEARLYRMFAIRKQQTPLDRFFAGVIEGDPETLAVKRIVEGMGLSIRHAHNGAGTVSAVGTLLTILRRFGPGMVDLSLRTLYAAFGPVPNAFDRVLIGGVTAFTVRYEAEADWERLVSRLNTAGMLDLQQKYKSFQKAFGSGGSLGSDGMMGRVIVAIYDHGRKNHLSPWTDAIGARKRPETIPANLRLAQRKALANVPYLTTNAEAS